MIKEILWEPPLQNWTKFNTDGVFSGVLSIASLWGRVFRNSKGDHLGSFAFKVSNGDTFIAELTGVILAFESASARNWTIVTHFSLVRGTNSGTRYATFKEFGTFGGIQMIIRMLLLKNY